MASSARTAPASDADEDHRRRASRTTTARCGIDGQPVQLPLGRATRWRAGIGMVHQELSIVPDLSVAENVFLGTPADDAAGLHRLAAHGARGRGAAAAASGIDVDPTAPRWARLPHRPAAAGRARPGAVLRRADHHPGRADLGALAARGGAALRRAAPPARRAAAASSSSRISSTTCSTISDTVTVFRNGRKIVTADGRRDRQGAGSSSR